MIKYIQGNIFDSSAPVLVNTVNCKGVMGAGLAKQFKERYPDMFKEYRLACMLSQIRFGGDVWIYDYIDMFRSKSIICFATKEDWRYASKVEWIERGLKNLVSLIKSRNIEYIALPKLGCTNGKLNWKLDVSPLMTKYLEPLNCNCEIYI